MTARHIALAIALLAASAAGAQATTIEEADAAFRAGRYDAAKIAYDEILREDPSSTHALHQRAILASWDNQLDTALVLVRRARVLDPYDPDLAVAQARFLLWGGSYHESVALYDSVLASDPENRDALVGRAQALSWYGHYAQADSGYRRVLARNPRDADAWLGLARVEHWEGDEFSARAPLQRALALDPELRGARELERALDAAQAPRIEPDAGMTGDSDRSRSWWQKVTTSTSVDNGARGFASVRFVQASDPLRHGTGQAFEAGASLAHVGIGFTGALGASVLRPTSGEERSTLTGRALLSGALGTRVRARVEYARFPFDENAQLIDSGLDAQLASTDADVKLPAEVTGSGGGSLLWVSDGNERWASFAALSRGVGPVLLGAYGRVLGWAQSTSIYFSPRRFSVLEARARAIARTKGWEGQLGAGLGGQQVDAHAAAQTEWHVEARLARRWGDGSRIELFGGATNSAEVSTTGAYRSYNAGLSVVLSL